MDKMIADLKKINSDLESIYKKIEEIIRVQSKTITLSFRDKNFTINRPRHSISIAEHKNFVTIAIDGVNEIEGLV